MLEQLKRTKFPSLGQLLGFYEKNRVHFKGFEEFEILLKKLSSVTNTAEKQRKMEKSKNQGVDRF